MPLPHLERQGGEGQLARVATGETAPAAGQQKAAEQGGDAG
jgi:hypothetical protein